MQLPDTLWLKHNVRRRDRLRDGEVGRVNFPPDTPTTRRRLRGMLERAVHIRGISYQFASASGDVFLSGSGTCRAVLDVGVCLGQIVEGRLR